MEHTPESLHEEHGRNNAQLLVRVEKLEDEAKNAREWRDRVGRRIGQQEALLASHERRLGVVENIKYDRVALALDRLTGAVNTLTSALAHLPHQTQAARTTIHPTFVTLKEDTMSPAPVIPDHMPDFILPKSTSDVGLGVPGPLLANGEYAARGAFAATELTEAGAITVEDLPDTVVMYADPNWVDPDPNADPPNVAPMIPKLDDKGRQIPVFNVRVKTPLEPPAGEKAGGLVSWTSPGMVPVDIRIRYGDPALGHAIITTTEIPD